MCRLSAEPMTGEELQSIKDALAPELSDAGKHLLRCCIQNRASVFEQERSKNPQAFLDLCTFLKSPGVRKATAAWRDVFQAQPPAAVIARCCSLCKVAVPPPARYRNYSTMAEFRQEVKIMQSWYKPGRRLDRPRLGLLRTKKGTSAFERGRRSVFNYKVTDHYRRLQHQLYMEGLAQWRRCALNLHKAQIGVQSGTLSCERQWAFFLSLFPPQGRNITEMLGHIETFSDIISEIHRDNVLLVIQLFRNICLPTFIGNYPYETIIQITKSTFADAAQRPTLRPAASSQDHISVPELHQLYPLQFCPFP